MANESNIITGFLRGSMEYFRYLSNLFSVIMRLISEMEAKISLWERRKSMNNGASSYRRFLNGDDTGIVEIVRDYKDGLILYLLLFTMITYAYKNPRVPARGFSCYFINPLFPLLHHRPGNLTATYRWHIFAMIYGTRMSSPRQKNL